MIVVSFMVHWGQDDFDALNDRWRDTRELLGKKCLGIGAIRTPALRKDGDLVA